MTDSMGRIYDRMAPVYNWIFGYWLEGARGRAIRELNVQSGEKVLEALCRMYPQADLFTHVVDRTRLSEVITSHNIQTTFINRLPGSNATIGASADSPSAMRAAPRSGCNGIASASGWPTNIASTP